MPLKDFTSWYEGVGHTFTSEHQNIIMILKESKMCGERRKKKKVPLDREPIFKTKKQGEMTSKFCENIFNPQFYMSSLFSHV
jgi:hypothetical protein